MTNILTWSNTYRFDYRLEETIPRLAWLAYLKKGEEKVIVYHGPWVETHDMFFAEGAWDGEFSRGRLDQAVSLYGSGGVIDNQTVIFAPPTHVREKIVSMQSDDEIFVSNSLVFLLHKTGFELDQTYEHYQADFLTIHQGIKKYTKQIPVKPDNQIHIHYYCNLAVKTNFSITELPKRKTEVEFTDFDTYKSFLDSSVAAIFRNADDPRRNIRFTPITTLSRGYDSTCCSVLARRHGCRDAISLIKKYNPADNGTPIADRLGLNLTEVDHLEYLQSNTEFLEAEIFAAGNETSGLYILSLEKYLDARILVTGFHGDTMWNKVPFKKVTSNITNGGSGAAFNEFRLRVGFIHFILPHLGAIQYPAVFKITHSPEMQKYSREPHNYDRPIAVRIITEENIPRELFGQTKMGAGTFPYTRKKLVRKILFKLLKLFAPRSLKQRIELIQVSDTYQYFLKEDSRRDLYRFWLQSEGKSLTTNNFLWGVARTRKNYSAT